MSRSKGCDGTNALTFILGVFSGVILVAVVALVHWIFCGWEAAIGLP